MESPWDTEWWAYIATTLVDKVIGSGVYRGIELEQNVLADFGAGAVKVELVGMETLDRFRVFSVADFQLVHHPVITKLRP